MLGTDSNNTCPACTGHGQREYLSTNGQARMTTCTICTGHGALDRDQRRWLASIREDATEYLADGTSVDDTIDAILSSPMGHHDLCLGDAIDEDDLRPIVEAAR